MEKLQLKIDRSAEEVMREDALKSFPNECCGFFFGFENGTRNVQHAVPISNKKTGDQRRRFQIDPKDYIWAERHAEENNLQLLGIYHSHPLHPAQPSEHDRVQAVPWFSYIILSVQPDKIEDLNSFQLNESRQFEQETIITK
jgi:proteasome lid subunit RPN8/RPN11